MKMNFPQKSKKPRHFSRSIIWYSSLASGASKAAILHAAMYGSISEDVPASILQRCRNVTVLADADAASLLSIT